MGREEFHTMLLHAARIVNSTPLHDAPESPNESQPITPHHLITQKDDSHTEKYSRPSNYAHQDLLAYGANRWKRIEALAAEFARYWKHYLYQIGTNKEKWYNPQRNAQVGDIALLKEKNTPRLEWPTGVITSVTTDKDGLVRRVFVQPHKKQGQTTTPQLTFLRNQKSIEERRPTLKYQHKPILKQVKGQTVARNTEILLENLEIHRPSSTQLTNKPNNHALERIPMLFH